MNFKTFAACALCLAFACGMAGAYTVNFQVINQPTVFSTSESIEAGGFFAYAFNIDDGYCITNIEVKIGKLNVQGKYAGLFVGTSEYEGDCCASDAAKIASLFSATYGGCIDSPIVITDERATKSAVSAAIANAASQLKSGDTFIYYQCSYGSYESVRLYGEDFTQEEFATCMDQFDAGVNIIVILDTDFADSMSSSDGKYWLLAGSSAHELCTYIPSLNMCTYSAAIYYFGTSGLADRNGDSVISVMELFDAASGYMKATGIKRQNPECGNVHPEMKDLPLLSVENLDAYGTLNVKGYYSLQNVQRDMDITVSCCPLENAPYHLDVQKFAASYKLGGDKPTMGDPMKVSATLTVDGVEGSFMPNEIVGPFCLKSSKFGCMPINFRKISSKGAQYLVVDEYWNAIGKLSVKPNVKKGLMTYKFSIKSLETTGFCYAFESDEPQQESYFSMRLCGNSLQSLKILENKLVPGKKFTSKLAKVQP